MRATFLRSALVLAAAAAPTTAAAGIRPGVEFGFVHSTFAYDENSVWGTPPSDHRFAEAAAGA
jgi:hypothetical protein